MVSKVFFPPTSFFLLLFNVINEEEEKPLLGFLTKTSHCTTSAHHSEEAQMQKTNFSSFMMWQSVWLYLFIDNPDHGKPCLLIVLPDGCQGERLLMRNSMGFSLPVSPFKTVCSAVGGCNFICIFLPLIVCLVLGLLKIWPGWCSAEAETVGMPTVSFIWLHLLTLLGNATVLKWLTCSACQTHWLRVANLCFCRNKQCCF